MKNLEEGWEYYKRTFVMPGTDPDLLAMQKSAFYAAIGISLIIIKESKQPVGNILNIFNREVTEFRDNTIKHGLRRGENAPPTAGPHIDAQGNLIDWDDM